MDLIEHAVSPENIADPFTIQQMFFVTDYRRCRESGIITL
jgi:hypothetical protein